MASNGSGEVSGGSNPRTDAYKRGIVEDPTLDDVTKQTLFDRTKQGREFINNLETDEQKLERAKKVGLMFKEQSLISNSGQTGIGFLTQPSLTATKQVGS